MRKAFLILFLFAALISVSWGEIRVDNSRDILRPQETLYGIIINIGVLNDAGQPILINGITNRIVLQDSWIVGGE